MFPSSPKLPGCTDGVRACTCVHPCTPVHNGGALREPSHASPVTWPQNWNSGTSLDLSQWIRGRVRTPLCHHVPRNICHRHNHYIMTGVNTLGPRQHRRRFADDIFNCIFFNENCCALIKTSLKYVRKGPIDNNPVLVQIMAWRRLGDKPFSEPIMVSLPTHICVARPQWVNNMWCVGAWNDEALIFHNFIVIYRQQH